MLERLVQDLARAAEAADAARPVAHNRRTGQAFEPGLGPHSESDTFDLLMETATTTEPRWYRAIEAGVPYPAAPRQKCDLRITTPDSTMLVEGKLLRDQVDISLVELAGRLEIEAVERDAELGGDAGGGHAF